MNLRWVDYACAPPVRRDGEREKGHPRAIHQPTLAFHSFSEAAASPLPRTKRRNRCSFPRTLPFERTAMDILQQASQTLSFKNALTNYHNGTSARIFVRSFDNRQRASRNGSLLDIVCVQSNNPNDRERMLLASSNTTYAAPLDAYSGSSFMIRPLAEILRDLNKRVPDQVLKDLPGHPNQKSIPWYHANRMLSFYAPGWCGEVRNIMYSADGQFITVTYRVTLRGSDGEVFREAAASVCLTEMQPGESVQQAEALAFVRACARFGLGLYLHHEEEWSISSS